MGGTVLIFSLDVRSSMLRCTVWCGGCVLCMGWVNMCACMERRNGSLHRAFCTLYGECQVVWVVTVIKGKYTIMSPLFGIRALLYTFRWRRRQQQQRRRRTNERTKDKKKYMRKTKKTVCLRNGKIVFSVSIRQRRRCRLALFRSIFGQRRSVYRKLFGYQIGTHGFRGTPENVQRNEKRFVAYFWGENYFSRIFVLWRWFVYECRDWTREEKKTERERQIE